MMELRGFRAFVFIWFGQLISQVGSAMTRFAITIWAYEQTQSATALALVGFFSFAPMIVLSPVAGALADRWNRKTVMMISDTAAGISTVALLLLHASGNLQIWHLYAAGAFASAFEAFQFPAFSAAITMLVPKEHFARASGMLSLTQSTSTIAAPFLAGLVLVASGISGVMTLDVVTFVFAVSTILLVHIPQPEATATGKQSRGSLWSESVYGFKYIWQRPGLLGMQTLFFLMNLFAGMGLILVAPMVLAYTGNNEISLGTVQAATGVGGLVGGLVVSAWGAPKRKAYGVFISMALCGILGLVVVGIGQSVALWAVGMFGMMFFIPVMNASNQAIWQAKVEPDVQGKVFAARRLFAQITAPMAMILGGLLADHVFEPAMMEGGALAPVFGGLVGTGEGSGMALIFVIVGVICCLTGLSGFLRPAVRNVEFLLPDAQPVAKAEPTAEDAPIGEVAAATT